MSAFLLYCRIIYNLGGEKMKGRTSNDQRSDVLNSNNRDYTVANNNRSNQMNPNNVAYHKSRGK